MLRQTEEQLVSISGEAVQAVQRIIDEKNLTGHALRIYVAGSSCCGVQFGMALDDKIMETDTAIDTGEIKIIIDNQSIEYARGVSIEFVNDPQQGQGFVVNAPHGHSDGDSCGCGDNGGGCGGDSCSCNA